ncbi:MAG: hypothetical protein HYY85_13480 [Deltaproteobacteria bacterium]|nr:hypothetical protein [Deltaproteobacteria bacterium]
MKTTIDIPDELYRQVKAKSALQGKRIRELTIELYRQWLGLSPQGEAAQGAAGEGWLEEWLRMADDALKDAPSGPSAREILQEDRGRLERRR